MAYDPKNEGWMTIFQVRNKVELPEQLTAKWWDKKKQVVAKMTKSTGMGDALKGLDGVFKKVLFQEFNPHPLKVQEEIDKSKKFISSPELKKLHDEFKAVRDLAKEQAAELKKSALTKKTAGVLEEIEEVADKLMVCVNPGSLSSRLKEALEAWTKDQDQRAVDNAPTVVKNAETTRKNMPAKIAELRKHAEKFDDQKEKEALFGGMYTLGRNITQSLGNLLKASKANVAFQNYNESAIQKLYDQLKPIGGAQSHSAFTSGLDQAKSGKLIDKLEGWGDEYIKLTKDIQVPAKTKV